MARGLASLVQRRPGKLEQALGGAPTASFSRRLLIWATHSCGGALGGAGMAATLWLLLAPLRTMPPRFFAVALSVLVLAWLACVDVGLLKRPALFNAHRQVPIEWSVTLGFPRAFMLYGLILGAYVFTYAPFASVFAIFYVGALRLSLLAAVASGAALGLGRTIPVAAAFSRPLVWRSDQYLALATRRLPAVSASVSLILLLPVIQHGT
jgi:hypothetical protein